MNETSDDLPEKQSKSLVQIKLGNKVVNAVYEPRCKVCNHPRRFEIEEKILLGHKYAKIAEWVSNVRATKPDGEVVDWPELTASSVKTHRIRGHLPMNDEIARTFAEDRAKQLGIDMENGYAQFVDHEVVQKYVLKEGYEALVKGEIKPDVKDLIAVSKILGDREKELQGQASIEEWAQFMNLYFTAVKATVSEEQWNQIVSTIQHHPAMKAMQQRRTIEG